MMAWGVTYVAHSSLLVAAVWLVCRFVRSVSLQETLWKVALVAPILTATLQVNAPLREVAPTRIELPAATALGGQASRLQPPGVDARREASGTLALRDLWIAVSALLLLRLIAARALFAWRIRKRADLLRECERLARLRKAMSCTREVRLTESSAVGSPIAFGWEIVVPRETFARLTDEQKETILAHEIAHLVRRDPLWLLAGEAIKALLFLQPLNWLVQRKMKECAELLCDDLAVVHTGNPKALAETLAELAAVVAPAPRAVAAMAEGGSNLMMRVTRVLMSEPERPMRARSRMAIAAAVVVVLAALAPGFAAPSPRSHDSDGKRKTWEGTIRLSGTHDDLQTSLRVDAVAVQYDDETAEVFFERGASLRVEETVGSERRRFVRDHDGIRWSGEFDDVDREAWLVNILHAHGKMRRDVARAIARE